MIQILDPITANGIAAGEVVERPASVIKELAENSLDAGSSVIHCQIEQGGIKRMLISDNGCGMDAEDAVLAFARHATSKLSRLSDLNTIQTMGFRGEALASIAAVSRVHMSTRQPGSEQGYEVCVEGGVMISHGLTGCPEGTRFEITDLFYNTPARYKFLKRDQVEAGYIQDLLTRLALTRPDVSFRLVANGKELLHTPGNNDLLSTIYVLFGKKTVEAMRPVHFEYEQVEVNGFVTTPQVSRGNRSRQMVFVNGRSIQSRVVRAALDEAGKTWFMKGKFPELVLNLTIPHHLVDVNVHPQKTEVRFWDEKVIFRAIFHSVRETLEGHSGMIHPEASDDSQIARTSPDKSSAQPTGNQIEMSDASSSEVNQTFASKTELDPVYRQERLHPEELSRLLLQDDFSDSPKLNGSQDTLTAAPEIPVLPANSELSQPNELDSGSNLTTLPLNSPTEHSDHFSAWKTDADERNELKSARLIGQVFQTYLLLESTANFLIIDQHAAHERILYERLSLQAQLQKLNPHTKQFLLVPVTIDLSAREMALIEENREAIAHHGFDWDVFGSQSIIVRAVPDTTEGYLDPEKAFRVISDALIDESFNREDREDEMYHMMACKAAVKAHDRLSYDEMKRLVDDLAELRNPFHCPHGRPAIIRFSRTDLDKLFKRIV